MLEQKQQIYSFDNFRLDVGNRELLRDGRPVMLPAKAFDMLVVLIESSGRLVGKDELFSRVWPDQIVEESNLTVQVSAIRRVLGERKDNPRYIVTVPGHGYRFTGDVLRAEEEEEELVIERHSLSRLTMETETERTTAGEETPRAVEAPSDLHLVTQNQWAPAGDPERISQQIGRPARFSSFVKAHPKLVAGVCGVALLLPASLYFGLQGRGGNGAKQPAADNEAGAGVGKQRAFALPTITKLTTPFSVRDAAISPDGKYVTYVRYDDGPKTIWLGQTNAGHSLQISQTIDADIHGLTFAPDGHSIYYILSGADYPSQALFKMSVTGGLPRQILTHVTSPITFAPDGRRLAFVRRQRGEREDELVIAEAEDGSGERVVARRGGQSTFSIDGPAWSPDGQVIALGEWNEASGPHSRVVALSVGTGESKALTENVWSDMGRAAWLADGSGLVFVARSVNSAWTHQLWLLPLPGGEARAITTDVVSYVQDKLTLAKDGGALLAVQAQNNYQLYVAPDGDPARARKLDMGAAGQFPVFDPAWTPDGRIIYGVVSGESRALWLMDADGGNRRQITPEGEVVRYPSVTNDGRHIIYQVTRDRKTDIWRVGLDGSKPQQLTTDGASYHPHCSPDGLWVVYVSDKDRERRVWRVNADGGGRSRLTDTPSNWPRVSPDGKWIACALFDENISPRTQLTVIPADGGPPAKTFTLTKTGSFNQGVRWSSDGQSIIFRDYRFGVWRQPLSGGPPRPLKNFSKLKIHDMDWSPDGKDMVYTMGSWVRVVTLISDFR